MILKFYLPKVRWIKATYCISLLIPICINSGSISAHELNSKFKETSYLKTSNKQDKITGTVLNQDALVMVGVSVKEKGTNNATKTDENGVFTINTKTSNPILVFSFLGYETIERPASQNLKVTMNSTEGQIDEVVVVGFGTQKKVNLTGAISHVGKEAFENRPVSNIGQALQGLVPNLNVSISNGAPNTTPGFNIRGGTSMSYNNNSGRYESVNGSPLVIIDGVEGSVASLNQINPNDILDMSFIKDASASAIYGTKAAFGVVLVRTKRGEFNQKGRISYAFDANFDRPVALPDILNSYEIQRSNMDRTIWTNGTPSSSDEIKLEKIQNYINNPTPENSWYEEGGKIIFVANVNPYKEVVKDWTPMQKHTLNTSGGSESINYYVSLGMQNQSGMYKINTDKLNRYNALVNLNAKVNNWFSLFTKFGFDQTNFKNPYIVGGKGSIWNAMLGETDKNINMPIQTGPNDPIPNSYTDNILAWMSYGAYNESMDRRISLVASPEFTIVPNTLKLKADLAFLPKVYGLSRYSPQFLQVIDNWKALTSQQDEARYNSAYFDDNSHNIYTMNIYADFQKTFSEKHNLSAIVGYNQEQTKYKQITNRFNRLLSADIQNPNAAEDPTKHEVSRNSYTMSGRAVFGRVSYNFADKYYLESNLRYDGSSKFTENERFVIFPAFSAGWRISQESFMENTKSWLNELKIRGSWGKLGNQPSAIYPYQPTLSSGKSGYLIDGQQVVYLNPPGLVSPFLTFEKATTRNLGLDATFLDNKLDFTFELYDRKTVDILTDGDKNYPSSLGVSPPTVNSGELNTKGFEVAVAWKQNITDELRYRAGFTLSDYVTSVGKYVANPEKLISKLYDGAVIGDIWGYRTEGILQEGDFAGRREDNGNWIYNGPYKGNLFPGYVAYKDIGGPEGIADGIINSGLGKLGQTGDLVIIGNNSQRYKFGITGNIQYKNFDLDLLIQGVLKRDVWPSLSTYWGGGAGSKWMYERSWTPERTNAEFPMYGSSVEVQDGYLINGAYVRLKQAIIGYTLPTSINRKLGIEKLRFTLAGYNLFEISKVPSIYDVDNITTDYPQKRSVAVSAQIVF